MKGGRREGRGGGGSYLLRDKENPLTIFASSDEVRESRIRVEKELDGSAFIPNNFCSSISSWAWDKDIVC